MSAQVTLKLTVDEFDRLREAVKLAADTADQEWRRLKEQGESQEVYSLWYTNTQRYERLLEHTFV